LSQAAKPRLEPDAEPEPARRSSRLGLAFERFAHGISHFAGSTAAFVAAGGFILVWLLSGPVFDYSSTWQMVVNTATTIVTFLMVFLIQRSQNKEALAVQLKLNEIVAALQGASNRLVNVEEMSEGDLEVLHSHYRSLAQMAQRDVDIRKSHSLEEADERHREKHGGRKPSRPVK
jgi:low affinity Fe/Cu permease